MFLPNLWSDFVDNIINIDQWLLSGEECVDVVYRVEVWSVQRVTAWQNLQDKKYEI